MDAVKISPYFLLAVVVAAFVLCFLVFKPFLTPIALGAIFAVVLTPVFNVILRYTKSYRGFAALLTVLLSAALILAPLFLLGTLIFNQALELYTSLSFGQGQTILFSILEQINDRFGGFIPGTENLQATLIQDLGVYAQQVLGLVVDNLGPIVTGITGFFLSLLIFLFALYYLLKDGHTLKHYIVDLSPLADTDDEAVLTRLEQAVNSVIKGNLTIALIQGVISGIGFALFGLPNAVLWGTVTAFAALIPGVGTSLIIFPAILYLYFAVSSTSAIGLLIWGILAVGLIDNFLGPRLIGRGVQLHPLLILLAVLGGLAFFGPVGIFLGPITISLLFALLSVYSAKRERISSI